MQSIKQLNSVKKEYDKFKSELSSLSNKLNDLKQRHKNKEAGIDYSDIEDLIDVIDNIKDEERYYIANIALATADVASKTTALVSQASVAGASWATFGFSVGLAADISGSNTKNTTSQTTSVSSNLNANNIKISTNKDKDTSTNIIGSNLNTSNNIDISTNNLNINASQDTYIYKEDSKTIDGSIKFTMYGGSGGSAGLSYSTNHKDIESVINNNSLLYSKSDININTSNDTTIKGANLRADNALNLHTKNLILESLRDRYTSNEKGMGIGAGIGFSGDQTT
ncbi:hemagglutinin repeat-containing protein [Campylobacter sp. RM13119]|uniref:hemagglutinin repeat-containing protein n=1 Tax=Campylobacter californiensis TaxID=1032243 RepID=UPI0014752EFB|nr:hemagglutinin repeat-containing protein [Campylobacter sp. RM13119]MBE3606355.1 hemagglutinin repeat-containing protein [Campylobacter sp. RM13119]